MDHDEGAKLARLGQNLEHLGVVEAQAVVGHEHLDRGMAGGDQLGQLIVEHGGRGAGDDHVEGVIDDRALCRQGVVVVDHGLQAHALILGGKGDHRGGAAGGGGAGRGLEGIGVDQARGRELLDVAVAVDAAGQHQAAGRVDGVGGGAEPCAQRRDAAIGDGDVAARGAVGGGDCAAGDQKVEVGHVSCSPAFLR